MKTDCYLINKQGAKEILQQGCRGPCGKSQFQNEKFSTSRRDFDIN